MRHDILLGNIPSHTFVFFSSQILRGPDTLSAVPPGSPGRTTVPKNNNQPRLNYKCFFLKNATIMIYPYPDIHTSKDSINLMKNPCTFSSFHVRSLALFSEICLRSSNGQISLSPRHPNSTEVQNCIVNPLFSHIPALSMTCKVKNGSKHTQR